MFLIATIVTTMLVAYPQTHRDWNIEVDGALLTIYLIPSILPLTTAWAAILAVVCGGRERLTKKLTAAVLAAGLACSIAMFADLAWVVPHSNQAFREAIFSEMRARDGLVFGPPLPRGDNEMSMRELRRQMVLQPEHARRFAFTYHWRWSSSAAPLILACFALLLVRSIKRRAVSVMIACLLCFGYWVMQLWAQTAMRDGYPVVLSAWLPNLVFFDLCLIAAAIAAWRSKTSFSSAHS